jgi:hypothetical protein
MKHKLIFGIIFFLIVGGFVLVSSEGDLFDFTNAFGIGENITGSDLSYEQEITSDYEKTTIIFDKEESFLDIDGKRFENIQPSSDELNAFIKLDESGEIIGADFMTNENGGTYNFFGEEIIVPANSRVTFDQKNGLIIDAAEGSEFDENMGLKDLKIKGDNIKLPNGNFMNSGELNYNSLGQTYISKGDAVLVNGVLVSADEELDVYFDGSKHPGNYVSFGDEFYFGGEGNPGEIIFEKGNDYFPNMKSDSSVKFNLGEDYSYVNIAPNSLKGFPDVNCYNQYSIETGELLLKSDGEKIILKDVDWSDGSVKMDVHTSVGHFDKMISIGEDSNYYSYITEGDISKKILTYNRKELNEGLEVKSNSYQPEFIEKYMGPLSNYLRGGQELAKECIYQKCPHLRGMEFKNQKEVDEFAKSSAASGCYLTSKQLEDCLGNSIYKDYRKAEDYYSILEPTTASTEGTTEKEYLFGLRKAFDVFIGDVGSTEYINLTALNFTYNPDAY